MKWLLLTSLLILVLCIGPLLNLFNGEVRMDQDWRSAARDSSGLAPDPAEHPEAVVQIYAARAFSWRGAFAVHTWLALKPRDASDYTVHEVIGWHARHGGDTVVSRVSAPDRRWYGQRARVLADLRGEAAAAAIPKIQALIETYPYSDRYVMWPGPNSNTFTAYIGRRVPELRLELPTTAIGKDYLAGDAWWMPTTAGHGWQFSIFGLLGVALASHGVEFNLLSLNFGLNFNPVALRIPGKWPIPLW